MNEKVILHYLGTDSWGRAVFKSEKGRHAKTANVLDPEGGFLNAENAMQDRIIDDLHTCEPWDDPDGEPGWPVDQNKIVVCRVESESEDSSPCP